MHRTDNYDSSKEKRPTRFTSSIHKQINPAMHADILTNGNEKTPLVVIDEVLLDTTAVNKYTSHTTVFEPDQLTSYLGNLLHSGIVDPNIGIGSHPQTGRFRANVYIDFN